MTRLALYTTSKFLNNEIIKYTVSCILYSPDSQFTSLHQGKAKSSVPSHTVLKTENQLGTHDVQTYIQYNGIR